MSELLRHLGESGAIYQGDDGRWVLKGELSAVGLPSSVREVVAQRVERLGDQARRVLSIGAVIGRDFDFEVLLALAETDEGMLIDLLDAATTAALLIESEEVPGRYRFAHALIQHTLYQELSATRRQRTHRLIAENLEQMSGDDAERVGELARHWVAATRPADLSKALQYVRRAAEAALVALAPDDAAGWYRQALELTATQSPPDRALRGELLVGLGTAQRQAGIPAYRDTLLEAADLARDLGDHDLLVAAMLATSRGTMEPIEADPRRTAAVRAALTAVGGADSTARARLLVILAEATDAREIQARREAGEEAVAIARRLDDESTLLHVLNPAYLLLAGPEGLEGALDLTAQAIELADRLDDPVARCVARQNRFDACLRIGDIDEADQRLDEMAAIAAGLRLPFQQWVLLMCTSTRALLDGRLDDAETAANAAFEIGTTIGDPNALAAYGGQLFELRRHQGRLHEIVDLFAQAAAENPAIPSLQGVLTLLYCEGGRLDEARSRFAADVASDFKDLPYDLIWLGAMGSYAQVAMALHDRDAAETLYHRLAPFADQVVSVAATTIIGSVALWVGGLATVLERYDDAERYLDQALAMHQRLRAPYWIARTELSIAGLLLQRGATDERRIEELVGSARRAAQQHGYRGIERSADALLESRP
jgi:tetratricopeptide (TPR) repeat protein